MTMQIAGKVAIVTGAGGGGSGRVVALRLAQAGASVVVSDANEAGGRETVTRIEAAGGKAQFRRADVGREDQVQALLAFTERTYGGLDILVNNAGPYFPGAPLERWHETLAANLMGAVHGTLYAIPLMRKRGGGAIVNFGSTSALGHGRKHSSSPAYDIAKAGVMRLTTTLASLGEREKIRVNCIVPDWVASEEVRTYWEPLTPQQRAEQGAPATLTPLEEIAAAVERLITDDTLAGRVLVFWTGEAPRLIPAADPGYAALE
jgi:NAD(P)-dependent dehydrogenase (short-subunit alcohol dehydrogenase family)